MTKKEINTITVSGAPAPLEMDWYPKSDITKLVEAIDRNTKAIERLADKFAPKNKRKK